jgi:Rps23 Pro-64 3,4-dihydroxylase Tpa1-like proline 4-hydroxylase
VAAAVATPPAEFLAASCVVFDEFLAPEELQQLSSYVFAHEADFRISEVVSPGVQGQSEVDYEHRKSKVLQELGPFRQMMGDRLNACLPRVMQKLGMEPFAVSQVEAQITASNHGDYFRQHNDNSWEASIVSRELTFVYFFNRHPKPFQGGELRLYDSRWAGDQYQGTGNGHNVVPEQNRIVFFRSALVHEILPVHCPSQAFADSRFTVNGWFHR